MGWRSRHRRSCCVSSRAFSAAIHRHCVFAKLGHRLTRSQTYHKLQVVSLLHLVFPTLSSPSFPILLEVRFAGAPNAGELLKQINRPLWLPRSIPSPPHSACFAALCCTFLYRSESTVFLSSSSPSRSIPTLRFLERCVVCRQSHACESDWPANKLFSLRRRSLSTNT